MTLSLDTIVRFVITFLFDGLWVAGFLAVVAWIALRAMRDANATTRHSILTVALLASLVLPVITAALTTFPSAAGGTQGGNASHAAAMRVAMHKAEVTNRMSPAPASKAPLPRPSITMPRDLALGIVALWLAGAFFVLLRLALSLWHLERLKKDALPVPVEYRAQLTRWTAATKGARDVRLCRSREVAIPIAVGLFDAMILVPEKFLEELSADDVDHIVLHELAHLRRADDWINAVERIASAVLFFNPGIAWLVAHLDLEREVACDDWVLQRNEPLPYANCLAKIVESAAWPHRAMSAPGAFLTRRAMSVRIERLLTKHRDVRVRTSPGPAGAVVATLGVLGIAAAFVSPSFAYTVPAGSARIVSTRHAAAPRVRPIVIERTIVERLAATPAPPVAVAQPAATPRRALLPPKPAGEHVTRPEPTRSVASAAANAASIAPHAAPTSIENEVGQSIGPSGEGSPEVVADSPAYIDDLAAAGYTNLTIDELTQLRAVGVTGQYIREVESAGFPHPSVRDLVQLRALEIQPDYIRSMHDRFGSGLDIRSLTEMKSVGITPEYVTEIVQGGYPSVTPGQLVELRAIGIDGAFLQRAAQHGFHNLTIDQLVRLKTMGVL